MVCRHGGGRKGCSGRWLIPSRLEGLCLKLLLSAGCEISVISCTTPALKLPCSCRSISFATGPSMMQRDLTFNASVHSSAAGRRKYDQDETAPAPLGHPAHSHCFSGHLNPLLLSRNCILQGNEPPVNAPELLMAREMSSFPF